MSPTLSTKQRIAFKIGARARKFILEGCPIEGYDYLYSCLGEAKQNDIELYQLLQKELEKFEKRMEEVEAE